MNDKSLYEPRLVMKPSKVSKKLEKDIQLFLVKQTVPTITGKPSAAQVAMKASKLIKDIVESNEKNIFSLVTIISNHNKFYGG